MEENKAIWKRMRQGPINVGLLEYLENLFEEEMEKGYNLKVYIGTDSQRKGKGYNFATAITISRTEDLGGGVHVGRGCMIVSTSHFSDKFKKTKEAVKERMVYEVGKSVEVAYYISDLLSLYDIPLEVHADVNSDIKWESNKALSECMGYIVGMGYTVKVKPEAWAATKSADRASRGSN